MDTYETTSCKHTTSAFAFKAIIPKIWACLESAANLVMRRNINKSLSKKNKSHTQADAFFHYKIPQEKENIFKERTTTEISELKPIFPSCISKGFDTSMVWVSTSVKGHFCDSFLQTGLCNDFTHLLCHILMGKSLQGWGFFI